MPEALGVFQKSEIWKRGNDGRGLSKLEMIANEAQLKLSQSAGALRECGWLGAIATAFMLAVGAQAAEPDKSAGTYAEIVLTQGNTEMSTADTYTHTLRITFSYDGPKLEITGVQRVAMRAPAPATTPQKNQTGYWLEVRDGNGKLLYHRPIHDPTRRHIESFGDAPGKPMRRHPATVTKGEFEVLVPDLPGAQTFRLHGPTDSAAKARGAFAPSAALSEHSFDDLRRRSSPDAGQGGRR